MFEELQKNHPWIVAFVPLLQHFKNLLQVLTKSCARFVQIVLVAVTLATVILPHSLIPQRIIDNSESVAFANMPGGGGPGPNIGDDRDGDGISDDKDICPSDPLNKCWRCSWGRLWNCLADVINLGVYYIGWAFRELYNMAKDKVLLPLPEWDNPWNYQSRLERFCNRQIGRDREKEGKPIYMGKWFDGSGGNQGAEPGCLVGVIFIPARNR